MHYNSFQSEDKDNWLIDELCLWKICPTKNFPRWIHRVPRLTYRNEYILLTTISSSFLLLLNLLYSWLENLELDTKVHVTCENNIPLRYFYFSSHHSFSLRTCSSSLGVKSFLMLKVLRISSGVLPLIMFATVLQVTSNRPLISR